MTKQEFKQQSSATRTNEAKENKAFARSVFGNKKQIKKLVRSIQSYGYKLLATIKAETGIDKGRNEENERLEATARHEEQDAELKAAGIV